jgi:hypothetical protein
MNFLFAISFAAYFTHIEDFTRNGNDVTWKTNGTIQIHPFHTASDLKKLTTCNNVLDPKHIAFSSVCDLNLTMTADTQPYNGQYYITNAGFNI